MSLHRVNPGTYPLKPSHLNTADNSHPWGSFGNTEIEVSAYWLVRYFLDHDDTWGSFVYNTMNDYYQKCNPRSTTNFYIGGLTPYLEVEEKEEPDGSKTRLYHITHEFVARYFLHAPAKSTTTPTFQLVE